MAGMVFGRKLRRNGRRFFENLFYNEGPTCDILNFCTPAPKVSPEKLQLNEKHTYLPYDDVRVKSIVKALSLVTLHKQPKGLGERPVLGRWFLAALVPLPARVERERAQGVCAT